MRRAICLDYPENQGVDFSGDPFGFRVDAIDTLDRIDTIDVTWHPGQPPRTLEFARFGVLGAAHAHVLGCAHFSLVSAPT